MSAAISPDLTFCNAVGLSYSVCSTCAEPLEHDRSGQARSASRAEVDLLAAWVLDALDIGARQDVHLGQRQPRDVVNAVLQIGCLAPRTEVFEDVGLRHRDVDAAKVEQVFEVRGGAVGDDRNDAQIVPIVKNLRDFVGERHIGAGQQSAGHPDSPLIFAYSDRVFGAAFFKRFRHRLCLCRCDAADIRRDESKGESEKRRDKAHCARW